MFKCLGKTHYAGLTKTIPMLILSYLLVEGETSETKLLEMFWPNLEQKKSKRRLSENLRQIKIHSDLLVQKNKGKYSLNIEADILNFDRAFKQKDYKIAISLYGGEFLVGIENTSYFPKSNNLLSWLFISRENFQQKYLESLLGLAEGLARSQAFAAAAGLAKQALSLSTDKFSPIFNDYYRIYRLIIANKDFNKAKIVQSKIDEFLGDENKIKISAKEAKEELQGLYSLPSQKYFIGRKKELAVIKEKLKTQSLVFLTGFPGIGKTQLAVKLAHSFRQANQFEGGIYYFRQNEKSELFKELAQALRQASNITETELKEFFLNKQALLIIDDFNFYEKLELLKRLIKKSSLKILLIAEASTKTIQLSKYHLKGLEYKNKNSEAEQYLKYLCTNLGFNIKQDEKLKKLLVLTAGHPAVLELIAAQTQTSPIATIIKNYSQNWQNLSSDKPELQNIPQSLCQILSKELKGKYWDLSLFQDSFSPEAAARVAGMSASQLSQLSKNLLLYFDSATSSYRIPALLKPYISKQQNSKNAKKRYCSYILRSLNDTTKPEINTDDVIAAWEIGLEHKLIELLKDTALKLNRYFNKSSQYSLGIKLLQRAQYLFTDKLVFSAAEVILHYHSGNFLYAIQTAKATDFSELNTAILRRFYIAYAASLDNLGHFAKAQKIFKKDLKLYKHPSGKKVNAHINLAYILMQQGHYEKAKKNLDRAEIILNSITGSNQQAALARAKGLFFYEKSNYALAQIYFIEAINLAEKLELKRLNRLALYGLANTHLAQNQLSQANSYIDLFISSLDNNPSTWLKIKAHKLLGDFQLQEHHKVNSVRHYYQAFELSLVLGSIPEQLFILNSLTHSLLALEENIARKILGFVQTPYHHNKMSAVDQKTLKKLISQYQLEPLSEWNLLNINELNMVLKKELPEQLLEPIPIIN